MVGRIEVAGHYFVYGHSNCQGLAASGAVQRISEERLATVATVPLTGNGCGVNKRFCPPRFCKCRGSLPLSLKVVEDCGQAEPPRRVSLDEAVRLLSPSRIHTRYGSLLKRTLSINGKTIRDL